MKKTLMTLLIATMVMFTTNASADEEFELGLKMAECLLTGGDCDVDTGSDFLAKCIDDGTNSSLAEAFARHSECQDAMDRYKSQFQTRP